MSEALERSLQAEQEYVDTHCHVFTHESFVRLMSDLEEVTGWRVRDSADVAEGANEFHVWLRPLPVEA